MKEQLAKMTIIELVRTAHSYSTSIKQTGVYSELVREMASRLEALNLAHIGAVAALKASEKRVAELENDEVRQRLANAEHQLHMAELAKHNLRASRKAQFRQRKAAKVRIAELEARTLTVKLPDEFYAIAENIRTQDNRITDQPLFAVMQKREIIGSDDHSPSRIAWVWEGEEVSELRAKRLEILYENDLDTRGHDRYPMQEIDEFVTACFTEQGCKDYISRNGHNLNEPFIYAFGSYRNSEYQLVRQWLSGIKLQIEGE